MRNAGGFSLATDLSDDASEPSSLPLPRPEYRCHRGLVALLGPLTVPLTDYFTAVKRDSPTVRTRGSVRTMARTPLFSVGDAIHYRKQQYNNDLDKVEDNVTYASLIPSWLRPSSVAFVWLGFGRRVLSVLSIVVNCVPRVREVMHDLLYLLPKKVSQPCAGLLTMPILPRVSRETVEWMNERLDDIGGHE